jgi:hypothetical protein
MDICWVVFWAFFCFLLRSWLWLYWHIFGVVVAYPSVEMDAVMALAILAAMATTILRNLGKNIIECANVAIAINDMESDLFLLMKMALKHLI